MESKVKLSAYAGFMTLIVTAVIIAGCVLTYGRGDAFIVFLVLLLLLIVFSLLYAPLKIKASTEYVKVRSALKSHKIPVRDIESVELFQPTMGSMRLCGSGGYMGYWGIFREGDVGRYTAYYGKASDCFIIRLKNGDKFVLGCENPSLMVSFISRHLSRLD